MLLTGTLVPLNVFALFYLKMVCLTERRHTSPSYTAIPFLTRMVKARRYFPLVSLISVVLRIFNILFSIVMVSLLNLIVRLV